jgi:hypothetical protein
MCSTYQDELVSGPPGCGQLASQPVLHNQYSACQDELVSGSLGCGQPAGQPVLSFRPLLLTVHEDMGKSSQVSL